MRLKYPDPSQKMIKNRKKEITYLHGFNEFNVMNNFFILFFFIFNVMNIFLKFNCKNGEKKFKRISEIINESSKLVKLLSDVLRH